MQVVPKAFLPGFDVGLVALLQELIWVNPVGMYPGESLLLFGQGGSGGWLCAAAWCGCKALLWS